LKNCPERAEMRVIGGGWDYGSQFDITHPALPRPVGVHIKLPAGHEDKGGFVNLAELHRGKLAVIVVIRFPVIRSPLHHSRRLSQRPDADQKQRKNEERKRMTQEKD